MQIAALILILCASLAAADASCIGGTYAACMSSFSCIQSWPESCICRNANVTRCGKACNKHDYVKDLQACPRSASKRAAKRTTVCVEACGNDQLCVLSYPAGCFCQYNIRRECIKKCGGVDPGPPTAATCPESPSAAV